MSDQRLLDLFVEDITTAQQLLALLEQEFTALSERNLDTLQALLAQKQTALQLLNEHSVQRSQLLTTNNLTADQQGLLKFAANSPLQAQLLDSSQQLNALVEQCQQANLRNGRLIRSNQVSVNSMLDIIRGADAPKLYDKTGSATSSSKLPPFSQA